MREFGARALLPFLASRPQSGAAAGSRPMSGVSGPSGTSSDGNDREREERGDGVYGRAGDAEHAGVEAEFAGARLGGAEAPPPTPPLPAPQGHSQDPPGRAGAAGARGCLRVRRHRCIASSRGRRRRTRSCCITRGTIPTERDESPADRHLAGQREQHDARDGHAAQARAGVCVWPAWPRVRRSCRNNHGSFAPAGKGKAGEHRQLGQGGAGARIQPARVAIRSLGRLGSANVVPVPDTGWCGACGVWWCRRGTRLAARGAGRQCAAF
ncbi:hypothetical protein B0H14DRAFT_2914419, partial [Mycena olivaceomarginata]